MRKRWDDGKTCQGHRDEHLLPVSERHPYSDNNPKRRHSIAPPPPPASGAVKIPPSEITQLTDELQATEEPEEPKEGA